KLLQRNIDYVFASELVPQVPIPALAFVTGKCNNPMEIDLVILVAKGEALHDQSSVQEIDDLSKQKRHVKSGEVLRHAGSTNFV
ncbi:hypothetical protein J6590_100213, partial [Homalodisca vitripennis]